MSRGRNKTPAERALEMICAKAGISFEDFKKHLEKSQGVKASKREFPQTSYNMVTDSYNIPGITQEQWRAIYQHCVSPKSDFGK